ncbi:MAG: glycosyltransferase family 2 protein [Kiloniellales bacterium]
MSGITQCGPPPGGFKRLIFVGESPVQLKDLPARDRDTVVIMSDRRLAWLGHFVETSEILIALDEFLSPMPEGKRELRSEQLAKAAKATRLQFALNARIDMDESLRARLLVDEDVTYFSNQRALVEENRKARDVCFQHPLQDVTFIHGLIQDLAAPGAQIFFCNFDDEFRAMELHSPHTLKKGFRSLLDQGYAVSRNSTQYNLEARLTTLADEPLTSEPYDTMVSLVIPLYNGAHYISETLQSVVDQCFESLQVVVIDDGSTDRSPELARRFADQFKKFTFRRQQNKGVSATRNHGLSLASGKYIAFLDADDLLAKDSISRRVNTLESSQFRVCAGLTEIINGSGEKLDISIGLRRNASYEDLWQNMYQISTLMGLSRVMKRQRFRIGQNFAEDWQYMIDLTAAGDQIAYCSGPPLSYYRWHRLSATGKDLLTHFDSCIALIEKLPERPSDEHPIVGSQSRQRGMDPDRIQETFFARAHAMCTFYAMLDLDAPVDARVVKIMNAITAPHPERISSEQFERSMTRAFLLPRQSDELHLKVMERAVTAFEKLGALAPTPVNNAFLESFRRYIGEINLDLVRKGYKVGMSGLNALFTNVVPEFEGM